MAYSSSSGNQTLKYKARNFISISDFGKLRLTDLNINSEQTKVLWIPKICFYNKLIQLHNYTQRIKAPSNRFFFAGQIHVQKCGSV